VVRNTGIRQRQLPIRNTDCGVHHAQANQPETTKDMSMTEGKIRRWVVYNSPRSGLQVCRVDVYVSWLQRLQEQTKKGFIESNAELGATLRRFQVISVHATHKEAEAMVKLTKE
jgi:hypothetical protein